MGRVWWVLALSGCAMLRQLAPAGPVMTPTDRASWGAWRASGVVYGSSPTLPFPVPAVQVWGLSYDLDLVVKSRHPDFDMHEYARITTPDGPLWLMKDARCERDLASGPCDRFVQTIVADRPDIHRILPEAPVPRRPSPVQVEDRSTPDRVDVALAYTNIDGDAVQVEVQAPWPHKPLAKRNGNTMGHSEDTILAVLDLSHRTLGRANLTIDGHRQKLRHILGVPVVAAIIQTQGGLSTGELQMRGQDGGVETSHGGILQSWTLTPTPQGVELTQHSTLRTIRYQFLAEGPCLELAEASVTPFAAPATGVRVRFDPALPDPRARFEGEHQARWVVDINGLPHAMGTHSSRWQGDVFTTTTVATAPHWAAVRPLEGEIRVHGDHADLQITRPPRDNTADARPYR